MAGHHANRAVLAEPKKHAGGQNQFCSPLQGPQLGAVFHLVKSAKRLLNPLAVQEDRAFRKVDQTGSSRDDRLCPSRQRKGKDQETGKTPAAGRHARNSSVQESTGCGRGVKAEAGESRLRRVASFL